MILILIILLIIIIVFFINSFRTLKPNNSIGGKGKLKRKKKKKARRKKKKKKQKKKGKSSSSGSSSGSSIVIPPIDDTAAEVAKLKAIADEDERLKAIEDEKLKAIDEDAKLKPITNVEENEITLLFLNSKNDFNLKLVNRINCNNIYSIKINNCDYYFNQNDNKYVLILVNKIYYILKFVDSTKDLTKDELDDIKANLIRTTKHKDIQLAIYLNKININYFRYRECPTFVNLENAKKEILTLNTLLKKKCDDLSLHLDYIYNIQPPNSKIFAFSINPTSLILCLFNSCGCISSIIISLTEENKIEISSKTGKIYEGKKYNKLLRCVVIIISKYIFEDVNIIISTAINPISAYLLITFFGGNISQNGDNTFFLNYLRDNNLKIENLNYKDYENYASGSNKDFALIIEINLTYENIRNAKFKFNFIVDEISKQQDIAAMAIKITSAPTIPTSAPTIPTSAPALTPVSTSAPALTPVSISAPALTPVSISAIAATPTPTTASTATISTASTATISTASTIAPMSAPTISTADEFTINETNIHNYIINIDNSSKN